MLNSSVQVYHKGQIIVDQMEKQVIKLVQSMQMYVTALNNGLLVSLSLSLPHTPNVI